MNALAKQFALLVFGVVCGGAFIAAHAEGQYGGREPDFDFKGGPAQKEIQQKLPAFPHDSDLALVDVDAPGSAFKLYIDRKSLTSTPDNVVAYTMVLMSSAGARNVYREGVHCGTRQFKTYAFGDGNGGFTANTDPVWQKIDKFGGNVFRDELYRTYLCDSDQLPLKPAAIIQRLAYPPTTRSASY